MYIVIWKDDGDVFVGGGTGNWWSSNKRFAKFFVSEYEALNSIKLLDNIWTTKIQIKYMHPLNIAYLQ